MKMSAPPPPLLSSGLGDLLDWPVVGSLEPASPEGSRSEARRNLLPEIPPPIGCLPGRKRPAHPP